MSLLSVVPPWVVVVEATTGSPTVNEQRLTLDPPFTRWVLLVTVQVVVAVAVLMVTGVSCPPSCRRARCRCLTRGAVPQPR